MPELELGDERAAALAVVLEDGARALGAVRYGRVEQVGACRVVLNPDSPLPGGGFAAGFAGGPGAVEATLQVLPSVFAEAGRRAVVVHASPSSVPELPVLCEELGYEAVQETSALLLVDPAMLVPGEPGRVVRPLPESDEGRLAPLLADALGWPPAVARRQARVLGHRLDDPRHVAWAAYDGGELVGVATAFRSGAAGQLVQVAVAEGSRRRRYGRALASAATAGLLAAGVQLVWATAEVSSRAERALEGLGFAPAYDGVTYALDLA